jgi:stage V sporulation protein AE
MGRKKRVIVLTDGDRSAWRAARRACAELGVGLIDLTAGAPTEASIEEVERAIVDSPYPEVVVLADDAGRRGMGEGELLVAMLAASPVAQIVAAVAVASKTEDDGVVKVDEAVTADGRVVRVAVDKEGHPLRDNRLQGDTVGVLRALGVPIVGIGDIGEGEGRSGEAALRRALAEARRLAEPYPEVLA